MEKVLNATSFPTIEGDDDNLYVPYDQRPETYIVPAVFILILVVGVTGNGILVLTLLRHANMRNVPNTYVLSLALGDLLGNKSGDGERFFVRNLWTYRSENLQEYACPFWMKMDVPRDLCGLLDEADKSVANYAVVGRFLHSPCTPAKWRYLTRVTIKFQYCGN